MNTITEQVLQHIEELPSLLQEEVLHYVEYLTLKVNSSAQLTAHCDNEPNGAKLARLMEEVSKKNLFAHIKDPAAWQREIRKDRPLPGRE